MTRVLVKKCQKPMGKRQKEQNMIVVGKEMFSKKSPRKEVPMYHVKCGNAK